MFKILAKRLDMAILKDAKGVALLFVLSDESVIDGHQERVMIGGINLKRFRKNPVALFQHDSYSGLIGSWVSIKKVGAQLVANLNISDNPHNKLAQWVKGEILSGGLKGVSIGFLTMLASNDDIHKLPGQQRETKLKTLLIEASVVIIQSNPNSVVQKFAEFLTEKEEVEEGGGGGLQLTEEELKEYDLVDFDPATSLLPEYKTFNHHIPNKKQMDIFQLAQVLGINTEGKSEKELEGLIAQKLMQREQPQPAPTPPAPTGDGGNNNQQLPSKTEVNLLLSLGEEKGFITSENKQQMQELAAKSQEGFSAVGSLIDSHKTVAQTATTPVSSSLVGMLKRHNININTGKVDIKEEEKGYDFVTWTKKDATKLKDLVMKGDENLDTVCQKTFGLTANELKLALKFGATEPIKTIYSKHLAEKLYPDNSFYKGNALVDTEIVAGEVVMGEVVEDIETIEDGEDSDDATAPKRRKDKKNTYKANTIRTRPTIISFVSDAVFSYDERNSILYNHEQALNTAIGNKIASLWFPTEEGSFIRTTGGSRPATAPGATGNRKAFVKFDFTSALSRFTGWDLRKQEEGTGNNMIKALFDDTFENDLWQIDDFIHVDKLGDDMKKKGVFGTILGVEIYLRSKAGVYSNATPPVLQSWSSVVANTGNLAALFWHTRCVHYAEGRSVTFPQAGRGEYGGDLFNVAGTTGATKSYTSQKGVLAVIQDHFV